MYSIKKKCELELHLHFQSYSCNSLGWNSFTKFRQAYMTLPLSIYFINIAKRTLRKPTSLICFRLWRSELRRVSSLKMRELYFSEMLTPSILHCVVNRLDISAEFVPLPVRTRTMATWSFSRGLRSRGAALSNHPHSAENKGKYCALPPLCASSDILRGDIYLYIDLLVNRLFWPQCRSEEWWRRPNSLHVTRLELRLSSSQSITLSSCPISCIVNSSFC